MASFAPRIEYSKPHEMADICLHCKEQHMRTLLPVLFCLTILLAGAGATDQPAPDTAAGWVKHPNQEE